MNTRTEIDSLGELEIPADSYWGIQTERSLQNFDLSNITVSKRLISALAMVKKACCQTNNELGFIQYDVSEAITKACEEIINGMHSEAFPLDALQGGAGTSTNMNLNEVIANRSLELLGKPKGNYDIIHPIETVNLHQSTNDVYPTALKIACILAFRQLSNELSQLQGVLQNKEKEFSGIVTIGRTEFQDAVPITLGSQFSSFAEAIARDRWRTFKCEERLRIVNIGGTAVGTGLTAPKKYIFQVIENLRQVTGLGLSRAEQVMDATANADVFVEVSGMLKANAVNIQKISQDLRILHYLGEITLPAVQAGSTIMPGKINPVIIEAAIITCMKVCANDTLISQCAANGTLQINEFMPLIAHAILESLDLLINTNKMLAKHFSGIEANKEICLQHFDNNITIITAFLPVIGFAKAEELLKEFHNSKECNFRHFLTLKMEGSVVEQTLSPQNLMSLGFR